MAYIDLGFRDKVNPERENMCDYNMRQEHRFSMRIVIHRLTQRRDGIRLHRHHLLITLWKGLPNPSWGTGHSQLMMLYPILLGPNVISRAGRA